MTTPRPVTIGNLTLGNDRPLALIAGPCALESRAHALEMSHALVELTGKLGIGLIYKTSFDKANRTSLSSVRGLGLEESLPILAEVREKYGCPVVTDVHEPEQCAVVAEAVDVLQIPAFLCRQTDLLIAAAQDRPRDQRQEGTVPRAVGHEERRQEDRQHGQREHPPVRARRQLRLQHARLRHARAADPAPRPAIRWCSTRPIRCSSRAGRATPRAASGASCRCWRAPRWRSASPPSSWRPIRIPTTRPRTGPTWCI